MLFAELIDDKKTVDENDDVVDLRSGHPAVAIGERRGLQSGMQLIDRSEALKFRQFPNNLGLVESTVTARLDSGWREEAGSNAQATARPWLLRHRLAAVTGTCGGELW